MRNKYMLFVMTALLCLCLCSCIGDISDIKVDLGTSDLYSEKDLQDAADAIKKSFINFEGCTLHSLTYAGDIRSEKEAQWDNYTYDEYVVFDSSFHSPKKSSGAWTADTEYTWSWILARNKGAAWTLINYGYC